MLYCWEMGFFLKNIFYSFLENFMNLYDVIWSHPSCSSPPSCPQHISFLMTYWVQPVLCENLDLNVMSSFRVWTTYQGPHNQRKMTFCSPAPNGHFFSWGWGIVSSPLVYAGISSDLILHICHSCCESLSADVGASLIRRHCFPAFLSNLRLLQSFYLLLQDFGGWVWGRGCDIVISSKSEHLRGGFYKVIKSWEFCLHE